jgi:hypothetical protein
MKSPPRVVALYAALFALASFGLFHHLDDRLLWADEAETALLALNVVNFGVPVVDDGRNDLSRTRPGSENRQALWVWSPWLDEYVAAASFLLLGKSTLAARLPFALFGLAALGLLGWTAWRVSRSHELCATAVLLCATCVPFLLHARQSRYYAIVMFAQLWIVYGVHRTLVAPGWRSGVHVCLGLVAIFYCNYILLPGTVLGLGLAGLLLARRHPRLVSQLVASGVGAALLAAPWLLYARPEGQASLMSAQNFGAYFVYYVGELHNHVASLAVVVVLPLAVALVERVSPWARTLVSPESRRVWEAPEARDLRVVLLCLVLGQLCFLGFAPDRFFRYVTPLLPLVLFFTAFVLVRFAPGRPLRAALLLGLVTTNWLAVGMRLPFPKQHTAAFTYPTFVRSVTSDYQDRLEGVLEHIGGEVQPEDSVYVDDHELPLIFYTGVRILEARDSQEVWQRDESAHPDWVFPAGPSALVNRRQLQFKPGRNYETEVIEVPRSPRGGSRPHPDAHAFFTADESEAFVIHRKRMRKPGPSTGLGDGD